MGEPRKCATAGRKANKPSFRRYWASGRYRRRRIARIEAHILGHPNDHAAESALSRVTAEEFRVQPMSMGDMALPSANAKRKKKGDR